MYRTSIALVAAISAGVVVVGPRIVADARADSCLPTDYIDGSTADQAVKKMESSGYLQPHDLKKGCDNYWYAHAMKGGTPVDVVLPPEGEAFTAHDS